jgi:hypothetical protein
MFPQAKEVWSTEKELEVQLRPAPQLAANSLPTFCNSNNASSTRAKFFRSDRMKKSF